MPIKQFILDNRFVLLAIAVFLLIIYLLYPKYTFIDSNSSLYQCNKIVGGCKCQIRCPIDADVDILMELDL